jgi:hypothetical protein
MAKVAGGLVDIADLGTDTGWVSLTLASGIGGTLEVRRVGDYVDYRGAVNPPTNWGSANSSTTIATVPANYRPSATKAWVSSLDVASAGAKAVIRLTTAGVLTLRPELATRTEPLIVAFGFLI